MKYTEEEILALGEDEDELTEEELILLLAALHITMSEIENELRAFYSKYGTDGVITYGEARKWVSSKNRIKRIKSLYDTVTDVFDGVFGDFEKQFIDHLKGIVNKESKFFGVDLDIDEILDTPWGVDNMTFRQRLNGYKRKWSTVVNNDFKMSVLREDEIFDVIIKLGKRGESMETILKRLWRTESNAVSSISRKKIYYELGVKEYYFLHMDICDCESCSDMDNRRFPISEYEVGVTANPLHPNCNDTTMPVI